MIELHLLLTLSVTCHTSVHDCVCVRVCECAKNTIFHKEEEYPKSVITNVKYAIGVYFVNIIFKKSVKVVLNNIWKKSHNS